MNEEQLKSLKEDFRDWLSHPLTETLIKIISFQKDRYLENANRLAYKSYYKRELNEQATCAYGKVDGMATILDILKYCKEDLETIDQLIDEVFGGKKDED